MSRFECAGGQRIAIVKLPSQFRRVSNQEGVADRPLTDCMISLAAGAIRGLFIVAVLPCQFLAVFAQEAPIEEAAAPVTPELPVMPSAKGDERIFGVIPNYGTVSNPEAPFKRLTAKEKWDLCWKSSLDPFTGVSALIGSTSSQVGNNDPKYGNGARGFAERFGAAMTDFSTQNLFQGFVLATILHEDPRYYRRGPKTNLLGRVGYALSMTVVTKNDSGNWGPNLAGVGGMGMGIVFSDLYYPEASVNGSVLWSRIATSMMGSAISNMMSEFWPDLRTRVLPHVPLIKKMTWVVGDTDTPSRQ